MFTRAFGIMIFCCSLSYASLTNYMDIHDLGSGTDGSLPIGSLFQARNGLIYGMTQTGGTLGEGMIFSFNPSNVAGTYTDIHNFAGMPTDGAFATGSLFQASNGLIYGMTQAGGANDRGMIFSFDPSNVIGTYTDIHDFGSGTDGQDPFGSLFQASNGLIYGMTEDGGTHNGGMIFSFDPANVAGTYTDIHDFGSGTDGSLPIGSLFQASNGLIYGMTDAGGTHSKGMMFSFNPANVAGTYTDIHDFAGFPTDGANPGGSLFQAENGLIYGMTNQGGALLGGMIFSFDPANVAGTYTDIHDFAGATSDGSAPVGSLFQARNGLIYGMTSAGGATNIGMIFSFDPANVAGTYTDIHDFAGFPTDGATPTGSLFQASNGVIYGMTKTGGPNGGPTGKGMIFSIGVPLAERAFRRSSAPEGYRSRGR